MHPFVLIPLVAAVAAVGMASAVWARDPGQTSNRLAAALLAVGAAWALLEVLGNAARGPGAALVFARLEGVAQLAAAPLLAHLFGEGYRGVALSRLRGALPRLYAATAGLAVLHVASPWFVPAVAPAPWGWSPVAGPAFSGAWVWILGLPLAVAAASTHHAAHLPRAWRRQVVPVNAAVFGVVGVVAATEVVLPLAGVALPPVGSALLCAAGGVVLVGLSRHGPSVVTAGSVAREVLEAFPEGIAVLRRDGRIRFANRNLARLLGRPREALPGTPLAACLAAGAPDPRRELDAAECSLLDARGRIVPVGLSSAVLREKRGTPIGHVVALRDLSDVVDLRNRLVTAGRLAAVGELAAAITHEINNPIAYVRTDLGLLARHADAVAKELADRPDPEGLAAALAEGRTLVAETRQGADRVAEIVRDVRRFSQAEYREREVVDPNRLCEEALRVALPGLGPGVRVERGFGDVPPVVCAPHELVQVFLNLLANAAHALDEAGVIRVSTAAEGDAVVVGVDDDGPGIPPEVMERIFDPFFTTKPVGQGTGLGLAISRQIVERHGGRLTVASRGGRGTSFRVRLPLHPPGAGEV